jgi:hypothetical protein
MPSIDYNFINELTKNDLSSFKIFVESGTYFGETIFEMEKYFDQLYTIEINEKFYNNVKNKYNGNKINFYLGASEDKLTEICNSLKDNTIFFLDGHWSAGDTGKGEKDCPLYEELNVINELFKHNGIIIVDDVRLFGKGPNKGDEICNWEDINIEKLLSIIEKRTSKYYFMPSTLYEKDRLIIHINNL